MSDKPQVQIDAEELERELMKAIERSDFVVVTAAAYKQAVFGQQVGQAILALLKHKNIISESEIQHALASAYHAQAHRMKNNGRVIMAPPPMIKPNGSF